MTHRVLLIEDDSALAAMVAEYLGGAGFEASACADGRSGLEALRDGRFDALVLDLMLPDLDGLDVCRQVRAESRIPILMLTARGDDTDRIVGLELGADDYLPKPFNPRELLARLRAILRRSAPDVAEPKQALHFGRLCIDPETRSVQVEGEERPLTSHQFDLLLALARSPGRVLSRERLMDLVRGTELEAFDRSIDVHISRIRAAIEDDPQQPRRIITVRGVGYVFAQRQDGDRS